MSKRSTRRRRCQRRKSNISPRSAGQDPSKKCHVCFARNREPKRDKTTKPDRSETFLLQTPKSGAAETKQTTLFLPAHPGGRCGCIQVRLSKRVGVDRLRDKSRAKEQARQNQAHR